MDFKKYISAIDNLVLEDLAQISKNNTTLKLNNTLKNAPISVNFTTKEPTILSTSSLAMFKKILDYRDLGYVSEYE
jgi:hypothetical protein